MLPIFLAAISINSIVAVSSTVPVSAIVENQHLAVLEPNGGVAVVPDDQLIDDVLECRVRFDPRDLACVRIIAFDGIEH